MMDIAISNKKCTYGDPSSLAANIAVYNSILYKDPLFKAVEDYEKELLNRYSVSNLPKDARVMTHWDYDYRSSLASEDGISASTPLNSTYCSICRDDVIEEVTTPRELTNSIITNHLKGEYCFQCVKMYLETEIKDAKITQEGRITCVCRTCDVYFEREEIELYLDNDTKKRYERFINIKRVDNDPMSRWCPRPQCGAVVKICGSSKRLTCAECKLNFCVKCSGAHSPLLSCSMVTNN